MFASCCSYPLSSTLRRQTEGSCPFNGQKPVDNSKTTSAPLFPFFFFSPLALECSITHRMSPLPGWWCHATKCLLCSCLITHVVSAQVYVWCVSVSVRAVSYCLCALLLLARELHHTFSVPNVLWLWSVSAECICFSGSFFCNNPHGQAVVAQFPWTLWLQYYFRLLSGLSSYQLVNLS